MFETQVALTDKLKQIFDQMTNEFIREKGYITCEFSIQQKYLAAAHDYAYLKNRELPSYGMWRIFKCEACISHNVEHPYHVEIVALAAIDTKEHNI
ncbi:hypothetical protein [Pseudomonas phage U1B]|nr:hypothetical protein [Pseudomonas phage T2P]QYV99187.1 hypothetical protein [Pseudomonas phage U1B]QYV99642.1 hypothetical protein [Pseudomonas phage U5]